MTSTYSKRAMERLRDDQAVVEDVITNDLGPLSTAVTALLDLTEGAAHNAE